MASRLAWLRSLRFQLIAGSIAGLIILFGLVSYTTVGVLESFTLESTRTAIAQTSQTLNLALAPHTSREELATLGEYLNALVGSDENGIVYLTISDEGGRAIAQSRSTPGPLPDTAMDLAREVDSGIVNVKQPILVAGGRVGELRYGLSTRLLREARGRMLARNLGVVAGALLVAIALFAGIGLWVSRQVGRLIEASRALASGDLGARVETSGFSEIARLAESFNRMADAVAERTEALCDSESKLNAMLNNPLLLIGLLDGQARVVMVNDSVLAVNNTRREDLIGRLPWELPAFAQDPVAQERLRDATAHALGGEPRYFELTFRSQNGPRVADFALLPARNEQGEVGWVVPMGIDVTDRAEARERLRVSEERLRATLESTPNVAVQWYDGEGKVLYWNSASERLYQWSSEDALGKTLDQIIHTPDEAKAFVALLERIAIAGEPVGPQEYRTHTRLGAVRWVESTIFPIPGDLPDAPLFVCMDVDITARKLALDQLEQERTLLSTLVRTIPEMVWLKDAEGVFVKCNPRFERLLGARQADIIGKTDYEFFDKETADFFRAHDRRAIEDGRPSANEEWLIYADDGHRELVETTKTPMYDARGRLIGVLGIAHDITERKRAEETLRASEERFRAIFEGALDGILVADVDSRRLVGANPTICAMLGYTLDELLNLGVADLHTPADQPLALESFERHARGERHTAQGTPLLRKDGSVFPADVSVAHLELDGRRCMAGFFRDITARTQAEQAIRQKEFYQRALLDNFPFLVWLKDKDGRFLAVNRPFAQAAGLASPADLVGKTDLDIWPGDLAESYTADDREVMDKRLKKEVEEEVSDRGTRKWFETYKAPILGDRGELLGTVGFSRDISQRRLTEEALRRAQKMDAVGQLSGGIAHDFNNILGIILGNLDLLELQTTSGSGVQARLETIRRAASRAKGLTKQLLRFSSREPAQVVATDINRLVVGMRDLLARSLTPRVDVQYRLDEGLWLAEIEPADFENSLVNLVLNARDAMPEGGRLIIETSNRTLDADRSDRSPEAAHSQYVCLTVTDTGPGIAPEHRERIFEPFFTTKPRGKGTGLGLAMVFGFVRRSRGFIDLGSEPGAGACFHLYLPRAQGEDEVHETIEARPLLSPGRETILVVDDEAGLRDLATESLAVLGYRTLTADNGPAALQRLAEKPDIDLLVTDVVMPGGMSGLELAERARELHPGIKVLVTSGYPGQEVACCGEAGVAAEVLAKPYRPTELAQRVRSLLDTPAAASAAQGEPARAGAAHAPDPIEWDPSMSVGVPGLDADHKRLLELVNLSRRAAANGDQSQCRRILDRLWSYTSTHFRREEAVMAACGFPSLERHRDVHRFLTGEVETARSRLQNGELGVGDLADLLGSWLRDHIRREDHAMESFVAGSEEAVARALADAGPGPGEETRT